MVEPKLIDIKSSSTAEDKSEAVEESPCDRWLKRREPVSVQETLDEKVKEFERFNEMLCEESEKELKSIRHKHLVATLKRLQSYKEEYDQLFTGINRHENETESKGRSYQDKLSEIEKTVKQAVEEAKKANSVPIDQFNSTVDVNCNVEVPSKVEDVGQKMNEPIATDSVTDAKTNSTESSDLKGSAEAETFSAYVKLQRFCIDFENSLQNFNNDIKLKNYRNDLKLFIRTLINTIAKNSVEDLRQKASQLNRLFSKQSVNYQNCHLDCNSHPDALNFCFSFAAQTSVAAVIKQASSGNPAATAFPTGAFIGMIWSKYPTFGKLFLGLLQEKCPFVIPYYPKRENDESETDHLITSGYCISKDGTLEPEDSYLKRMKSMIGIYGIILQSNIKNHPRGIKYAWNWLASVLRLPPQPLITAGVLLAFLQTTSFKLYNIYGKQFVKLLNFIETIYTPMIASSTGKEVTRQTLVSLEVFVKESIDKSRRFNCLDEPLGLIRVVPENF